MAWLLPYAIDTPTVSWALYVASLTKSVGLCQSVQHTAHTQAGYVGVPPDEIGHWAAGENHQACFLRLEWRGQDASPLLRGKLQHPAAYAQDNVRFEIMRYLAVFLQNPVCTTASSMRTFATARN